MRPLHAPEGHVEGGEGGDAIAAIGREVLLDAMQYAEIAQHHMNNLSAQLTT